MWYKFLLLILVFMPNVLFANYFTLPVKEGTEITAYFDHTQNTTGEIYFDGTNNYSYDGHNGTDFNGVTQDDIYAVYGGEVKSVYWSNSAGWTIHIWHPDIGLSTLYSHVGTTTLATSSDQVSRYAHIAEMDNTGASTTGDHLHFGVVDNESLAVGKRIDPFGWSGSYADPWPYNQGYLWTDNPPSFDVPTPASTTEKSGRLYTSETWTNDTIYLVDNLDIEIEATLTIEAGTIVKFLPGSGINVWGTLNAEGTMAEPVYFTSYHDDTVGGNTDATTTPPTEGDWKKIYVTGLADMDNVVVRYGGGDASYHASIGNAGGVVQVSSSTISKSLETGLAHAGPGVTTVENSFIMDNLKYGLIGGGGSGLLRFVNNKFYNNGVAAVIIDDPDSLGDHYGNKNPYYVEPEYNKREAIWLEGTLDGDLTLQPGLPFHVSGESYLGLYVNPGASLTMEEGAVMKNSSNVFHVLGELSLEGTEENPVYITSYHDDTIGGNTDATTTPPAAGDWKQITIDINGVANFEHAIIRYGGGGMNGANIVNIGGVVQVSSSTISKSLETGLVHFGAGVTTVENSFIIDNLKYGLVGGEGGGLLKFVNNKFFNNGTAAAFINDPDSLGDHYGNIDPYNFKESIWLEGTLDGDLTLQPGLPFHISGELYLGLYVNPGASLTMEEGVVMKNSSGHLFHVTGQLSLEGTEENPVYITSYHDDTIGGNTDGVVTAPAAGDWKQITIDINGVANLEHAIIRYGGANTGFFDNSTNIFITGGTLTVSSSTISNAYKYGISHSSGTTTITDSLITENIEDGLHFGYGTFTVSNSIFSDNGIHGLNSPYGNTANAKNNYWGNSSGPYHVSLNPSGSGDSVSDYVDFTPWLTVAPF